MKRRMLMLLVVCPGLSFSVQAITPAFGLSCITEGQYDMNCSLNLVTLLRIDGSLTIGSGSLEAATIHILKANTDRLAADWQVFSNIEEENMSLGIAVAGIRYRAGAGSRFAEGSLFAGIRNVNEDYFVTPVTAFFTNSSCGIFPTLSANLPLANYPLSGICLDLSVPLGNRWELRSSLYNGIARPADRPVHLFRFRPRKDGLFSISSLNYQRNGGNYTGGFYLHGRLSDRDDTGERLPQKTLNTGFWLNIEQCVHQQADKRIDLLAQASVHFSHEAECRYYAALGFLLSGYASLSRQDALGLVVNMARFRHGFEKAGEISWKTPLTAYLAIQPAFHFITNPEGKYTMATCRVLITF